MALNLGDHALARRRAEEALAAFQALDDPWGIAYSNMMVGNAIGESAEDLAKAVPYFEDSIRSFDESDDEHFALIARFNLAWVVGSLGDPGRERALNEEIIERAQAAGASGRWSARGPAERTVAMAKASLAMLERDDGQLDAATDLMRDSIETLHQLGATMEVAINLGRLANVLAHRGDGVVAAGLMAKSDAMLEELGVTRSWWDVERNDKTRALLAGLLEPAALTAASESGRTMTTDEAIALAVGPV
jgi:tetratricopeptide (TPR) repeat protein